MVCHMQSYVVRLRRGHPSGAAAQPSISASTSQWRVGSASSAGSCWKVVGCVPIKNCSMDLHINAWSSVQIQLHICDLDPPNLRSLYDFDSKSSFQIPDLDIQIPSLQPKSRFETLHRITLFWSGRAPPVESARILQKLPWGFHTW